MYAIVEIAGQQFKVAQDQKVFVHRLEAKEGSSVSFEHVLLLDNGKSISVGAPAIAGASVSAKVLQHLQGDKVIVFKKKRRKGYRVKNGHRQQLTELLIEGISENGSAPKKSTSKTTDAAPKAAKEAPKKAAAPKKATASESDLSGKTVAELRALAKAKDIQGFSGMKKAELLKALGA